MNALSAQRTPGAVLTALMLVPSHLFGLTFSDIGAVPTFESIGITATYSSTGSAPECGVEFREKGSTQWRAGHVLWTDTDSRQFRGSLVMLEPGTEYEIRLQWKDGSKSGTETVTCETWTETFPEGEVTRITSRNTPLIINQSGTRVAYRVYCGTPEQPGVIDLRKNGKHCIEIDGSHIIIRDLVLTNPENHGIHISGTSHDIVIEHCTIKDFGPAKIARDGDGTYYSWEAASGIYVHYGPGGEGPSRVYVPGAERLVIQNCRIGPPAGCASAWHKDWGNRRDKGFNATADAITTHSLALSLTTGDEKYRTRLLELTRTPACVCRRVTCEDV